MQSILEKTKNLLKMRNYSPRTIKSYLFYINQYLLFAQRNNLEDKNKAIASYLLEKQNAGKASKTINLSLNSIKFFYREVMKSNDKIDFKCARGNSKLPVVLSRIEIKNIITNIINSKHKLMVSIAYAAGLRVSEVVNLKVRDIDLNELTIHIKLAKGNKDRISVFPAKLKENFQSFIRGKRGDALVFESNRGGKLTTTSL